MSSVHVLPLEDAVFHEVSDDCICGPSAEFVEGGVVWTHHSLDGRELNEP